LVASFADYRRRPKPRRDVDHYEDPDLLLFASDDCSDLIGLKFRDGKTFNFSMTKSATASGCSFQPAMNCIPGDLLGSSNSRLIEAFDTEGGDLVKDDTPMMDSIIRCPSCRAERLPTSLALVAPTLSPPGRVETVANDGSGAQVSRGWVMPMGTAETLHGR